MMCAFFSVILVAVSCAVLKLGALRSPMVPGSKDKPSLNMVKINWTV